MVSIVARVSCFALAGIVFAAMAAHAAPKEIVIGASLPLSGLEAKAGGFYREGYELAFGEAMRRGGLLLQDKRLPVRLQLLDDASSVEKAGAITKKLLDEHVDFLLGSY